jgi:hypothetical protein
MGMMVKEEREDVASSWKMMHKASLIQPIS